MLVGQRGAVGVGAVVGEGGSIDGGGAGGFLQPPMTAELGLGGAAQWAEDGGRETCGPD